MQFENVDDVESRESNSLQHDELQVLRELRPIDHSDDRLRGVRSVTADAVDEHSVEPASGKDCSDDGNVASMRSRKWGVVESSHMRQSFGANLYFTFVPAGTDGSTLRSDGSPPIEAASTIPFDSMPISFAGCRFATITTFLPTNSSGVYLVAMPATSVRSFSPSNPVILISFFDFSTFSAARISATRRSISMH